MGVGRAAEPEMLSRRLAGEMPFLAAAWSEGERSLKVERRRLYTVGTTVKNVMGSVVFREETNGAANRDQTAVALKGNKNSIVEPEKRGARIAFMVPWMWCSGSTCSRWSLGE